MKDLYYPIFSEALLESNCVLKIQMKTLFVQCDEVKLKFNRIVVLNLIKINVD